MDSVGNEYADVLTKKSEFGLTQNIIYLLLVILLPLLVNLWGKQPFELPKIMLMRSLVWLLFSFTLRNHILTRRALRFNWQLNSLTLPVALLAIVIVTSTLTAANRQLSLWGSYNRGQGAVTLLTYLLLCLLAAKHLRAFSHARQILAAMAAVSAPLILFGLANAAGWNPFNLITDARSPIYATLGRANFTGAYLAILTPILLALFLVTRRQAERIGWAILLGGSLVVIGLTLARSVWVATAVSLTLFVALWWGNTWLNRRSLTWAGAGLFLLASLPFVFLAKRTYTDSVSARLLIWQYTLKLIGNNLLLGYGPDALQVVFPRVYPPQLVYYQGRNFFVDRAHNLFLDWTVTTGLAGLLAYLLVLAVFTGVLVRALQRRFAPKERALLIAILAAVIGNAVNNLLSFDITSTAAITWLLMGAGVALATPPGPKTNGSSDKKQTWRQRALSVLLLTGVGVAIWQFNARPLLADNAARAADRYALRGDWVHSIAAGEQAVDFWPFEAAHYLSLSQFYAQQAVSSPEMAQTFLSKAELALQLARQLQPDDSLVWLQTAQFYAFSTLQFNSNTHNLANSAFKRALTLSPNNAGIYTAWGQFYLKNNAPQQAALLLRRAVSLDASNGAAYLYLGAAEYSLGRFEVAAADYREAIRIMPESDRAYAQLANCYRRLNRFEQALQATEEALQRNPRNALAIAVRQTIFNTP